MSSSDPAGPSTARGATSTTPRRNALASAASQDTSWYSAPCGFTYASLIPAARQQASSAPTWYTVTAVSSSADISRWRGPKPTRSGYEGWAPTVTSCAAAARQVRSIVTGSPAWNPHATLALVTTSSSASSSPIRHDPYDSPRSALRSTFLMSHSSEADRCRHLRVHLDAKGRSVRRTWSIIGTQRRDRLVSNPSTSRQSFRAD